MRCVLIWQVGIPAHMTSIRAVSFACLTLALACSPTNERPPARALDQQLLLNGTRHVLRFEGLWLSLAVESSVALSVPREPVSGHTTTTERWSHGATFVVTASGLALQTDTSNEDRLTLRVGCTTAGEFLVDVASTDPDGLVSRDSFPVRCVVATRLDVSVAEETGPTLPVKVQLGGDVWVNVVRYAGEEPLGGEAPVAIAADSTAFIALTQHGPLSPDVALLHATSLVREPEVLSAHIAGRVPIEIVDEPDWAPTITVTRSNDLVTVTERNVTRVNERLLGLGSGGCTFEWVTRGISVSQAGASCSLYLHPDDAAFAAEKWCATFAGRRVCEALGPTP